MQEVSDWLLLSRSITPWVSTIGAVVRTVISKAAHELQVTLPARSCDMFQSFLVDEVVDCVYRENNLTDFKRIEPEGTPLLIPFKHYGAAVGPRGQTIRNTFGGNARLVWSISRGHELDGVFEFWVPKSSWSTAQETRAKNEYSTIMAKADYR